MIETPYTLYERDGTDYSKGFIYVASIKPLYYELAIYSATTLKDYYPNASITLFTHESFVDDRVIDGVFDCVKVNIPQSTRAKMWCMARTPYESTAYIDSDSYINHKDIQHIHEFTKHCDLNFGSNAFYTVSSKELRCVDKAGQYPAWHHGSICIYESNESILSFHQRWYDEYLSQIALKDWPYEWAHSVWKGFDMFTLWRIVHNHNSEFSEFSDISVGCIPHRWSSTTLHLRSDIGDRAPVVVQVDRTTISELKHFYKSIKDNIKSYNKKTLAHNPNKYN